MRSLPVALLLILPLVTSAALAQQPAGEQAFVTGISAGDLLNVRERPSPLGRTIGRLPNGALVEKHECELVEGYEWCRVDALDLADLGGWAPARYLESLGEYGEDPSDFPVDETAPPDPSGSGSPVADRQSESNSDRQARLATGGSTDLPPGLEARFGGAEASPPAEDGTEEPAEALSDAPQQANVPVPTPRPGSPDAGADPSAHTAAAAPDAGTTTASASRQAAVAGEIPCARRSGQPMTRCVLMVSRLGEAAADLTVVWPEGGIRIIEFREGRPAGTDADGELRYTREETLNLIRIGAAERFEILDSLALGD